MLFSALAAEAKANRQRHVTSACRLRNVVRPNEPLSAGIFIVSDANQRVFQEADDSGENLLARHARQLQIAGAFGGGCRAAPNRTGSCGQTLPRRGRCAIVGDRCIVCGPAHLAGRLNMAARRRANPNVVPRRGNHQRADSSQGGGGTDRASRSARNNESLCQSVGGEFPKAHRRHIAATQVLPPFSAFRAVRGLAPVAMLRDSAMRIQCD